MIHNENQMRDYKIARPEHKTLNLFYYIHSTNSDLLWIVRYAWEKLYRVLVSD